MFNKYNNYCMPCPYFCPTVTMHWRSNMPSIFPNEYSIPCNSNPCRKCSSCFEPHFNIKMKKVSINEIED